MPGLERLSPEERATVELVRALRETGNLHPLVEALRNGVAGPKRARDALRLLGELDLDLLVQVCLDTMIRDHLDDSGIAYQTRRQIRPLDP